MDIHIHIDEGIVRAIRGVLGGKRGAVLAGIGVLAAAGALYATAATPPNTFKAGDVISSSAFNQQFQQLYAGLNAAEAKIAALEAPKPCPSGMVVVGDVCVDKYEASIWGRNDGTPVDCAALQAAVDVAGPGLPAGYGQYQVTAGFNSTIFPVNGSATTPLYACSIKGVQPSYVSWFQAQSACALSGKHLITNAEWQAAVAGTIDPGANDGADGSCNTNSSGDRKTGLGATKCVSRWGVEDGIGNIDELTDEWSIGVTYVSAFRPWGPGFGGESGSKCGSYSYFAADDLVSASSGNPCGQNGPSSLRRGGRYDDGAGAGAFAAHWSGLPGSGGFRCAVRKP